MAHRFEGERTLMRIFIGESDRCAEGPHRGKPLYEELLDLFREKAFAGATARGIAVPGRRGTAAGGRLISASQVDRPDSGCRLRMD